ncbi:hypothetical protein ACFE04_004182 [Oxalis oulophora]
MDIQGHESSKNEFQGFAIENGEGSNNNNSNNNNVVFSREAPLISKELTDSCSCSSVKKLKARVTMATTDSTELAREEKIAHEKKLSRQDRVELGRLFQGAVSSHDWELAESLIFLADPQTLNDALCITLDSVWFLNTQQELIGVTGLIKKIIGDGAYDFTRVALRTSFLASCVSACQSRTMSLADTVTVMAQR